MKKYCIKKREKWELKNELWDELFAAMGCEMTAKNLSKNLFFLVVAESIFKWSSLE